MSFEVHLYTDFAKRKNSTRRPSGHYDNIPCVLKAPSSIISPTIEISYGEPFDSRDNSATALYTYAYIPAWKRYYFIRDIRYMNRVWEIDLEVDVLATYKAQITGSTKYVLRSQTAQDVSLVDSKRLMRHHVSTAMRTADCNWINYSNNNVSWGAYVVGIIGKAGGTGVVSHYVFDAGRLAEFLTEVFRIENYDVGGTSEVITPQLVKAFMNPSQYIVSIMWFPFAPEYGTSERVVLGWWPTNTFAPKVSKYTKRFANVQINGTTHPQSGGDKSHFLNTSPYTTRSLFLPCFGEVPVDTERGSNLQYQLSCVVDYLTGEAQVDVRSAGNDTTETPAMVARVNGQIGVPLPIAQTIQNGGGMLSALAARYQGSIGAAGGIGQAIAGVGSSIGGAVQGSAGNVGAGVSGMVNGITNAGSALVSAEFAQLQGIAASIPTCYSSGAFGSFLEVMSNYFDAAKQIILSETFVKVSDTSPSEIGLPLAQNKALSTLSGFVQLANGNIDTDGSKQEKDALEAYLTTGFYIE